MTAERTVERWGVESQTVKKRVLAETQLDAFAGEEQANGAGFVNVALKRPVHCEFTYRIPAVPEGDAPLDLRPGMRVVVPFGRRREVGVVVSVEDQTDVPAARIKAIAQVLDGEPVVGEDLLKLTRWLADYYACSWGEALAAVLPTALKREGGTRKVRMVSAAPGVGPEELADLEERFPKQHRLLRTLLEMGGETELRPLLGRLNVSDAPARTLERKGLLTTRHVEAWPDYLDGACAERPRHAQLSEHQDLAVQALTTSLEKGGGTFLLRGVTGSGKTEVYLRLIEQALVMGRGAIVLVPEIALTPQTVGWFRSRFGDVAVLHSRMTDAQRLAMWMRVKRGEARVVVGARSAVFAPVDKLGVIIVDEEHEPSYKQGNAPRYHGRDVAVWRAHKAGAVCVLGSATPSLESWANAIGRRYEHLELPRRVGGGELPPVEVVDMREEKAQPGSGGGQPLFSRRLTIQLGETLERGEQAILFLNRRGFAPVLWCSECKQTVSCRQCDVSLTFHRRIRRAVCHSCCEEQVPPTACPTCTAPALRYIGMGSERVEEVLSGLFPQARVRRMDSDTMHRREDYELTLDAFGKGELDVLVGTQMIAKGLDFPGVTLVGVMSADSTLHLPDFRAAERTFQLLAQVSGRAGRGQRAGRIIVQTMTPEHPAVRAATHHDYLGFAGAEVALRKELGYPPAGRLLRVVVEDTQEHRVSSCAQRIADVLEAVLAECAPGHGVQILGPAPAPMAVLRGRHRQHLLVKSPLREAGFSRLRAALVELAAEQTRPRISIDVDPVGLL
jgi:primosomal protein N' (replication factor Y)